MFQSMYLKLKVLNFQKKYIVEIYEYVTRDQVGENFIRVILLKTDPYFRLGQLQNLQFFSLKSLKVIFTYFLKYA